MSAVARIPARIPIASIARWAERLFSARRSGGTLATRSAIGEHRGVELVGGMGAVGEPALGRLDAGHRVAGEQRLHPAAQAHQPRLPLHVGRRHQPHRRVADRRVLGDVDEVARRRQLGAAGEAVAVDLGDDRRRHVPHLEPVVDDVARPPAVGLGDRPLDVVVRRRRGRSRREKHEPAPRTIITETSRSRSAARSASNSAPRSASLSALRFSGRLSVSRRTLWRRIVDAAAPTRRSSASVPSSDVGGDAARHEGLARGEEVGGEVGRALVVRLQEAAGEPPPARRRARRRRRSGRAGSSWCRRRDGALVDVPPARGVVAVDAGVTSPLCTIWTTAATPRIAVYHSSTIASRPSTSRPRPRSHDASSAQQLAHCDAVAVDDGVGVAVDSRWIST